MSAGVGSFEKYQSNEGGPTPVTARVSPTERIRAQIDELFASEGDLGQVLEEVARLATRLLLQTALEAEVTEFLGRDRYERRVASAEPTEGSRNGYSPVTIKTTAGPLTLKRPKLRGTTQRFASRLLGKGATRTNAIESLVIAGYVRGLSTRDVEAAIEEALGPEATVSKSTVSRICEAIKIEFEAFKRRDLSGVELEYLYLDGSHFKMHPGAGPEPVLVAWGITTDGKPVLLSIEPGSSESIDAWRDFLRQMTARGLREPLLVVSDGGAGLIGATELVFTHSARQRCLIHRERINRPSGVESSSYLLASCRRSPARPPSPRRPGGPRRSRRSGRSSTRPPSSA
jgi:transposase-like protein